MTLKQCAKNAARLFLVALRPLFFKLQHAHLEIKLRLMPLYVVLRCLRPKIVDALCRRILVVRKLRNLDVRLKVRFLDLLITVSLSKKALGARCSKVQERAARDTTLDLVGSVLECL